MTRAYDDPVVRAAAVSALGRYNGAVVAVDPNTGRILTVVNQKIAFGDGYIPCSTIKPTIALAALEENVITRDTMLKVGRRKYMNLTEAMAHSNNVFFESSAAAWGSTLFPSTAGCSALANLPAIIFRTSILVRFPIAPPAHGGVARMSSFGEGIQMTPFQLAALSAAFANGGTLYYLQYPADSGRSCEFRAAHEARIEYWHDSSGDSRRHARRGSVRHREIAVSTMAATKCRSEKRALATITRRHRKIGWFITYADEAHPKIALAVLLRGNTRSVKGPTAAVVAGRIYRKLREQNYFANSTQAVAVKTGN